jgi:hypothetical protein
LPCRHLEHFLKQPLDSTKLCIRASLVSKHLICHLKSALNPHRTDND